MLRKDLTDKFEKYLNGTAKADEAARIQNLLASANKHESIRKIIENDWDEYFALDELHEKDFHSVLEKIHRKIRINQEQKGITIIRKITKWYAATAAILLIPLFITWLLGVKKTEKQNQISAKESSFVTIVSPLTARVAFELPDGTSGMLKGGSSIKYALPFRQNRNVKLTGEAYFDVTHDTKNPFTVEANRIKVKVLGTQFSLCSFTDEDFVEVVLEKGKVECSVNEGKQLIELKRDERLVLSNDTGSITKVDAAKYTAWKDGKLIFKGDSMEDVARRISHWYNVDVEIPDSELNTYSFHGTFQDDSLEEVLRLLKMTSSQISYKIEDRHPLPDGSFTKKKIILYKQDKN